MKAKKILMLTMVAVFSAMFCLTALATEVQPYYIGSGAIDGRIGNTNYTVTASTTVNATRIEVSGTLYESWLLGDTQVTSSAKSSSGQICNTSGEKKKKSGKKYRLDYSATFYYSDGTSETVSGSTTG